MRISVVVHDFIFTPDTVTLVQTFSIRVCCENLFSDGPMSFSSNDSSNIVRARWRVRSWVQDPLGAYNLPIIYNKKSSPFGFCVCIYFPFSCVILFSLFFFWPILLQVAALKEDGCPKVWVVTSDNKQQHAAHGAVCILSLEISFWSK